MHHRCHSVWCSPFLCRKKKSQPAGPEITLVMPKCAQCAQSEARFRCQCGARYCGAGCQRAHWRAHRRECRAARAQLETKIEMDKALQVVVEEWDEAQYACVMHVSRADALAGGYARAVAMGDIPATPVTVGGVMCFMEPSVVQPMIEARRTRDDNVLQCFDWTLALPDSPPRPITTIMLNCSAARPPDTILQLYAPERACTGRLALHFFDPDRAVSVMSPLMDVE